jgi:hypothetical protein
VAALGQGDAQLRGEYAASAGRWMASDAYAH